MNAELAASSAGARQTADPSGLLVIRKPSGPTSFQIVNRLRRILQVKRVGHCGTLDPMASGILLVVFGKATRCAERLMAGEKVYWARVRFGIRTDTGDRMGKVIETAETAPWPRETVDAALQRMKGDIRQLTPAYSATRWQGKKLYEYARAGITAPRPPRLVTVHEIQLTEWNPPVAAFRVRCSKGTYIRTLAEDLGAALGAPATLDELVRERSGDYGLEQSIDWSAAQTLSREQLLARAIAMEPAL